MNYQKLFNYMSEQHGVDLLESDIQEIINIVNDMQHQNESELLLTFTEFIDKDLIDNVPPKEIVERFLRQ